MILIILFGCLILAIAFGIGQFVTTPTHTPKLEQHKLTKLDALVERYLKQDPCDPSSTIDFLMGAESLSDPFTEAREVERQPPQSRDLVPIPRIPFRGEKRPQRERHGDFKELHRHVMDELARAYAVPTHTLLEEKSEGYQIQDLMQKGAITHQEGRQWHEASQNERCPECHKTHYANQRLESVHPMDEPYPMYGESYYALPASAT